MRYFKCVTCSFPPPPPSIHFSLLCLCRCSGPLITKPSWPLVELTGGFMSGTLGVCVCVCVCVCVMMWPPCSKIGEEQSPEDAEDGPPELLVCECGCAWPSLHPLPSLPGSSSMEATQQRSRTSRGTQMSPGWSAVCQRTTFCKCGRW